MTHQSIPTNLSTSSVTLDPGIVELDLNKILIVDDSRENLLLMEYMFKGSSYKIVSIPDSQQALAIARAELPALIVSDIAMPVLSGLELLTALKADELTQNIAVILVTAHHRGSRQLSEGLLMGADDYIYRPFMQDEFLSRVEAVMRVKRAEADTRRQAKVVARRNKGLELVNELALAVNSALEFQEILASAMPKLTQLLEAEAVSLLLYHEEQQELVVNVSAQTGQRVSTSFDLSPAGPDRENLIETQAVNIILKVLREHATQLNLARPPDPTTIQTIPLRSKDQMNGVIAILNRPGKTFDEAESALLNSAAGIIAVAMENARLLESTQQQVDDLIALNEIGRALTSTLNLDQILKQTTLLIQRSLLCEAASLWLMDPAGGQLVLIASSGLGSDAITGLRLPLHRGIAGYVARTGESYIAADVSKDKHHYEPETTLTQYQPRSILSVPVQVKGQIVGVMQAMHQKVNWFDHQDLRLAYPVASFVGIAVENARLFSEVQDFSRHMEQMVTERTKELAEEKEKTEAILASMADGLVVLDADNRILAANAVAEEMLNFQLREMVGRVPSLSQLQHPIWRCISGMAGGSSPTETMTVDVPGHGGSLLSIQAHAAKVRNETGQMIETVIVLRDITALKEVERMKARFMAGVTHELKTPLAVIRIHADNLQAYHDRLPPPKRAELTTSIQTQVKLLEQLIEDILTLSRLDTGGTPAEQELLDLGDLVDRVVAELHPLAEAKQLRFEWRRPTAEIPVMVNREQIKRVARNLVDNAIRYTPVGGSVKVQTRLEQSDGYLQAELWISDTGIGIPAEYQSRIFDRFYRVDSSHTIPGTGLGLSIVQEIINAYGGHVHVQSTPGVGSTFVVTLPGVTAVQTT